MEYSKHFKNRNAKIKEKGKKGVTFDLQKAASVKTFRAEYRLKLQQIQKKKSKTNSGRRENWKQPPPGSCGDQGEAAFSFLDFLNWNDEQKIALPNVMRLHAHTLTSTEAKPNGSHWLNTFPSKWDDFLVSGAVVWHIIDRRGG